MAKKEQNNNERNIPEQQFNLPEIYTNTALSNFSPYEFEITLGLASANHEGVRPLANIRMSPQFTKEFAHILMENIKLYEENFGKISLPDTKGKKIQ